MTFRPKSLDKNITVKANNRPIKIVYLVPYEESPSNHEILDAVFHESYTRWGGALTLIIPTNNNSFLHEEYSKWLEFYDPDFIYTYVDLEQELIKKLDHGCCPIALISYKNSKQNSDINRWQDYLPNWGSYFQSISSLTTIHSPHVEYHRMPSIELETRRTVITQYERDSEERFLTDNFGTAFGLGTYPNPIPGLFDTCCLVKKGLPEHMYAGTTRIYSFTDVLSQITSKKSVTISKLAIAHSESIPRVKSYTCPWAQNFNLFIGDSYLDRIHFWNARHLSPDYIGVMGALLVSKKLSEDTVFINQLGQFLNRHNFLGQNNSQPKVAIRSYSLSKEELFLIRDRIISCTFNTVYLNDPYDSPAIPTTENLGSYHHTNGDTTTFKVNESVNEIQAAEPLHFAFSPARFKNLNKGQWAIDLVIERHNNLSRYSNIIDTWSLPRRSKVTLAFTNNLGKVSREHLLTLLPKSGNYNLYLPNNELIFRHLLLDFASPPHNDLRASLNDDSYKDIAISDKGQNLRGVISMFNSLDYAYACLTNKFWRKVLRDSRNEVGSDGLYTYNQLDGFLPTDRLFKEELKNKLHFENIGKVKPYLSANLKDTLEFLINKEVFYQVHQWRCSYCGNSNIRTFDHMRRENDCEICGLTYFAPIDLEWKYKLNDFVYRSLCERNGLTVLWALGYLQDQDRQNSYYYLPEVDLYPEYDNYKVTNEIDILFVLEGKFYAAEVKLSAAGFTREPDDIKKFVNKINLIRPDVALLVFEQYCEDSVDLEQTREDLGTTIADISARVGDYVKVKTVIASDFSDFSEHPIDLGCQGKRVDMLS
jgi:ribosomal protein S27E